MHFTPVFLCVVRKLVVTDGRHGSRVRVVLLNEVIGFEPLFGADNKLIVRSKVPSFCGNKLQEILIVLLSPFEGGNDSYQDCGG